MCDDKVPQQDCFFIYIFSMFKNFPSSRWEKLLPITHPASPLVSQKSNVLQKSKSPVSPKSNVENIKFKEIHMYVAYNICM